MNRASYVVAVLLVLGAGRVAAQTPDCRNPVTQGDMSICAGLAAKQSDAALNRNYVAVMARLSPPGKAALRDAQRAWISFRDKQCFFESNGNDGGSIAPMIASACAQALTDQRARALERFKTCADGDTSCPR